MVLPPHCRRMKETGLFGTIPCRFASCPPAAVSVAFGFPPANAQQKPQPPQSLRLYVLDCGKITPASVEAYGLKPGEMANTNMITPCFLIVHPRGSLIWGHCRTRPLSKRSPFTTMEGDLIASSLRTR